MEEFDEDDFGDLYTDVEVKAGSINSIQALTQLLLDGQNRYSPVANDTVAGGDNTEAEEAVALDESESESESEDDLNIVLNDNVDDNHNEVINGMKLGFQNGRNGRGFDNEEENGVEEVDQGNNGLENDGGGSGGGLEGGSGRQGGCNGGGSGAQFKHMRSQSAAFSSNLKSNGSAGVASYTSMLVRGNREDNGCTPRFGTNSIGSQSGHNFSLPRSRTILEVNIDALEWKPWRHAGADIADFFNFGLDEDSWKCYCNRLDRYREQETKVNGYPSYKPWSHSKQYEVGSGQVLWEAAAKNPTLSKQRTVSPSQGISSGEQQLQMGKPIQVEDGIGERRASVDVRHPVERDSGVIIQIPVQDMGEDLSSSVKVAIGPESSYAHEASDSRESGDVSANDGDMLCFDSAIEGELAIMGHCSEETGTSSPERCFKDTLARDCSPVCMGSDSCGSVQVSDADENHHEDLADGNSYETAEATRSSDGPKKSVVVKPMTSPTRKEPESPRGEQCQHGPNSSPSQSHDLESRHCAYIKRDKFHAHSARASPNSLSEVRESVTFDYTSSKDSRSHSIKMKSDGNEYCARSRTPIKRNLKFHQRKSSRMSESKIHLDYEDALYLSDSEKFHDFQYSTIGPQNQRNRHHGFDFSKRQDFSYYERSEFSLSDGGGKFYDYQSGAGYAGYSDWRGHRLSGYERDRYSRNVNRKHHFPQQRKRRSSDNVMEKNWDHCEMGLSVQEMDSLGRGGPRQFISEKSPFVDGRNTRWKWKSEDLDFKRRMKNDIWIPEYNGSTEVTPENCRPFQYNGMERDFVQRNYDRPLPYGRSEARNPVRSKRRFRGPINASETTWCTDWEDEKSRYTRNQFSFWSYREPRTVTRKRGRDASLSKTDIFGRLGGERRHNCVERYGGSREFGSCAGLFDNDESMKNPGDQDDFVRRRQYRRSGVLQRREKDYSSWHPDDSFKADGIPFNSVSKYKKSDTKHSSGGGKLIDHSEPEQDRYKFSRDSNSDREFLQNSDISHIDNVRLTRIQDSNDKHMVVGDRKSSRCFEAGSLMCYGRYEYLNWNADAEQRTSKDLKQSHLAKVVQADNTKGGTFLADANLCDKFPDGKCNDSPDIEEGQIITDDFSEKPMEKTISCGNRTNAIGTKNISSENPRILEIMAKMEKRRERFKDPITLINVSEKNDKAFAEKVEAKKLQRPLRKRKWVGS